jgi:hypothetical protein
MGRAQVTFIIIIYMQILILFLIFYKFNYTTRSSVVPGKIHVVKKIIYFITLAR